MIGRIIIDQKNVFDTGKAPYDRFPYTWANAIHIISKESTVRSAILFREGDPFNPALIEESERLLRQRVIFRYVTVTPQEPMNGKVDIHIKTEDVWTLAIHLSYGTAGGVDSYRVGVLERNFLGMGVSVGGFIRKDLDRYIRGATFKDPYFLGTRWELFGGYGTDNDGREYQLRLERPFRSILERTSGGTDVKVSEDEDHLYENGDEVASFRNKTRSVKTFVSRAVEARHEGARRWMLTHEYIEDQFFDFRFLRPLPQPPRRQALSALLLGYNVQGIRFVKRRGVITFDRDEDLNTLWDLAIEAGPSLEALGATEDSYKARGDMRRVWIFPKETYWFTIFDADGRLENSRMQDGVFRFRSHVVKKEWLRDYVATLTGEMKLGKNLSPEKQFLLGGENGLRGYSVRQFSGNKSFIASLESREVLKYDWLQLMTVGWAVFADTGGVWKEHENMSFDEFKSDVGFGIRFAPSRSVDPGIIRADLAYALNENNQSSRWVFNVGGEIIFGKPKAAKFDW